MDTSNIGGVSSIPQLFTPFSMIFILFINVNRSKRMSSIKNKMTTDKNCDNITKGELLTHIVEILEVLPQCECQRIYDYVSELFLS